MNRHQKTLQFLKKRVPLELTILDLGTPNALSTLMQESGYKVLNTQGEDLDCNYGSYTDTGADVVTAFEIFEHMFAPYNILKEIKSEYLVASVPLRLWFARAYWNESNEWDRHYHEFERRQFDFLLEKTGWEIIDWEQWVSPPSLFKLGVRPLLRRMVPRYYIVYCRRKKGS